MRPPRARPRSHPPPASPVMLLPPRAATPLLSVAQVADREHVTTATVLRWIRSGKLAATRDLFDPRHPYRVSPAALAAFRDDTISLTEFAAAVDVHPYTAQRWCREGLIPGALRTGRGWRIPRNAPPYPVRPLGRISPARPLVFTVPEVRELEPYPRPEPRPRIWTKNVRLADEVRLTKRLARRPPASGRDPLNPASRIARKSWNFWPSASKHGARLDSIALVARVNRLKKMPQHKLSDSLKVLQSVPRRGMLGPKEKHHERKMKEVPHVPDGYINTKAIAAVFGVNQQAVCWWARDGKIPFIVIRKRLYFPADAERPARKTYCRICPPEPDLSVAQFAKLVGASSATVLSWVKMNPPKVKSYRGRYHRNYRIPMTEVAKCRAWHQKFRARR